MFHALFHPTIWSDNAMNLITTLLVVFLCISIFPLNALADDLLQIDPRMPHLLQLNLNADLIIIGKHRWGSTRRLS
jgi:hypothetical protein